MFGCGLALLAFSQRQRIVGMGRAHVARAYLHLQVHRIINKLSPKRTPQRIFFFLLNQPVGDRNARRSEPHARITNNLPPPFLQAPSGPLKWALRRDCVLGMAILPASSQMGTMLLSCHRSGYVTRIRTTIHNLTTQEYRAKLCNARIINNLPLKMPC